MIWGGASDKLFRGNGESEATRMLYGESAELFSSIIDRDYKSRIRFSDQINILDVGSSRGELLDELIKLMPGYKFECTATDTNADALYQNSIAKNKFVCDAEKMPFANKVFDVVIMRYVLQFNNLKSQRNILNEVIRVTKGFALVQHAGADSSSPDAWRAQAQSIFNRKDGLPEIYRKGMFYSSSQEIETIMNEEGINYEKVSERRIDHALSRALIEKFKLSDKKSDLLVQLLGDKDYIVQTTWIIYSEHQ